MKISLLILILLCTVIGCGPRGAAWLKPARAADWEMVVNPDTSVEIRYKGAPVAQSNYIFWGPEWQWVGVDFKSGETQVGSTSISGAVSDLGLQFDGAITYPQPSAARLQYRMNATRALQNIIGGGLEWNLKLDAPALENAGEPELLPNNTGWKWPVEGGAIEVRFSEPVASVYFERGNKNHIRTFFAGPDVPAGRRDITMTVQLPAGGERVLSAAERYGPADTANWYRDALAFDAAPVDLSFLNHKPAGARGFVRAEGDQLVFADGTPARFWGGNIAAYAIFSDREAITKQAKRIAQLGYNLMRIHHHDSMRWVSPTIIANDKADSQQFDAAALEKLDWWIKALRDEGVYVWLDLHVGREFKAGDDIPGFADLAKDGATSGEGKGFNYFNPRLQELMRQFQEEYLNHVNPHTGLAYKDDPAIMGLLVTNENDITHHFGNMMLGDKGNPYHNAIFERDVQAFAQATGLPTGPMGRTWEAGPSKIFLSEWEYRFGRAMVDDLRRVGAKVPISTTNFWGNDSLFSLPALTAGDIIDAHSYGTAEALNANPRYDANYIAWIGAAQVNAMPLAITEWNVEYPALDRFISPLYTASIAALQGWDAPMIYNYSQAPLGAKPDRADKWSTYFDPALTGLMPAAALAFRQGHVSPAKQSYLLQLDRENAYFKALDPTNSATIRTLVEQSKLSIGLPDIPELDWDKKSTPAPGDQIVTDPNRDFIPAGQNFVASDTGELRRDWQRGIQTIDTPKTQATAGWIGGQSIALQDVTFQIATNKAAVAVSSLDGQPLAQSKRLLISTMARVLPGANESMPYLSEPVTGTLTLRNANAGLRLIPLSGDGRELEPLAFKQENGVLTFTLTDAARTHWFIVRGP